MVHVLVVSDKLIDLEEEEKKGLHDFESLILKNIYYSISWTFLDNIYMMDDIFDF